MGIEIVSFSIENGDLSHCYVTVYQRVVTLIVVAIVRTLGPGPRWSRSQRGVSLPISELCEPDLETIQ